MLVAALTGGIATGKSVAAEILHNLGCYLFKADESAHQFMLPGTAIWEAIVTRFGKGILKDSAAIDRKKLGKIVFSDEKHRRYLNEIIHPEVRNKMLETIERLKEEAEIKIFISEAALIIEAGNTRHFDKIIVTHCRAEIQLERVMMRRGISETQARKIIGSQMPQAEKITYADYLIDTSGAMESTIDQTEKVFRFLYRDYELKKQSRSADA